MISLLTAALMMVAPPPSDAAGFVSLMRTLHGDVKGVSFLFEGEMLAFDRGGALRRAPTQFQGHYALRPGRLQAGLLEVYTWVAPNPPTHRSIALLDSDLERSNQPMRSQILNPKTNKPWKSPGGAGSLNNSPSPEWFVYTWYFLAYGDAPVPGMLYENLGWDDVAGHRCLKVRLSSAPSNPGGGVEALFWIDVERGGHPLKVESYFRGDLLSRADQIELSRVKAADGKSVWFPVKGEMNVYGSIGGEFRKTPMARETYGVVLGSLQINLDLPDSVFVVHTKPRTEIGNTNALRAAHTDEVKPAKVERPKTDPVSVKARLDANLAEADRQAKEIEASSPARTTWGWTGATQALLALLGVALIGSATAWKWRRS